MLWFNNRELYSRNKQLLDKIQNTLSHAVINFPHKTKQELWHNLEFSSWNAIKKISYRLVLYKKFNHVSYRSQIFGVKTNCIQHLLIIFNIIFYYINTAILRYNVNNLKEQYNFHKKILDRFLFTFRSEDSLINQKLFI